jgi:RES domain-containing protein
VRLWRICRAKYAGEPLSGRGGMLHSGRWHREGIPVVYTSSTLSLAALEILVHVDVDLVPEDLVSIEIDAPGTLKVKKLPEDDLPRGWFKIPPPAKLQKLGTEWLRGGTTALLKVPSAVIRHEYNYLINPMHPGSSRIKVVAVEDFALDPRLARR